MPSPFPGMDPYLENPVTWPDLHGSLIAGFRRALNPILRPKYVAHIEERIYISEEDDPGRKFLVPGMRIVKTGVGDSIRESVLATSEVGTMDPITIKSLMDDEFHETRLAITDVATQ